MAKRILLTLIQADKEAKGEFDLPLNEAFYNNLSRIHFVIETKRPIKTHVKQYYDKENSHKLW